MGQPLKGLVERILRHGGAARIGRSRLGGRALVLAYHNVLPSGHAGGCDRSLHLPQREFSRQLDLLQDAADVVPLDEVFLAPPRPARGRVRIAITFDDAYVGAMTAGVEELRRRGLPATVFVTPGFLGGRCFWWDEILPPRLDHLPADIRERLLVEHAGQDAQVREWAARHGYRVVPAPEAARCASEALLSSAAEYSNLSFGAHTWSHPNLARIRGQALTDELLRPLQWLESRYPRVLRILAYPYGLTDPVAEAAAAAAGYHSAFRVTGGWLPAATETVQFRLPRLDVSSRLSLDGFALRLAGMFC